MLRVVLLVFAIPSGLAAAAVPQGIWLVDSRVAVQVFECGDLMCGRILWLLTPRDAQGEFARDFKNPDPALRSRALCGMTVIWGMQPSGPNSWGGGWFYNPDDGLTYSASADLVSPDLILARLYLGIPLFGQTKTMQRVPRGTSSGWC